jgi:hypothetical protein
LTKPFSAARSFGSLISAGAVVVSLMAGKIGGVRRFPPERAGLWTFRLTDASQLCEKFHKPEIFMNRNHEFGDFWRKFFFV